MIRSCCGEVVCVQEAAESVASLELLDSGEGGGGVGGWVATGGQRPSARCGRSVL